MPPMQLAFDKNPIWRALAQIDKAQNKKSKVTKTVESKLPLGKHSVDNTHRA